MLAPVQNQVAPWPLLRQDLILHEGPVLKDGSPSWVVHDPVLGSYFKIGWLEFEVLVRWRLADPEAIADQIAKETTLEIDAEDIEAIKDFFLARHLFDTGQAYRKRPSKFKNGKDVANKILHNYLMIRIPLIKPDYFLEKSKSYLLFLTEQKILNVTLIAAIVSLFLVSRQWDFFIATFVDTFTLSGFFSYVIALSVSKAWHELGHALFAKKYGLRVPRMGVAIVLLLPMLYTDVNESWRLKNNKERLSIASAGIRFELIAAVWATLLWLFLPEGELRGAMFFIATTNWILTLFINASPFMRFDGYYILSDFVDIPNLHDESSKALKYAFRTFALGLPGEPPYISGRPTPMWVYFFGLFATVYRFFLYLGIAVTVYHHFFKSLGFFLFMVEIWWFIVRPLWQEIKYVHQVRAHLSEKTKIRATLVFAALILVFVLPWRTSVTAPGWVHSATEFTIIVPETSTLTRSISTDYFEQSQTLAEFSSLDLALREDLANSRIENISNSLFFGAISDTYGSSVRSSRGNLSVQQEEYISANSERDDLQIKAPFEGQVVDPDITFGDGALIARNTPLAKLIDVNTWVAEAYVEERFMNKIILGDRAHVYIQGFQNEVLTGTVASISSSPIPEIPTEMLWSEMGGPLSGIYEGRQLLPRRPLYRVLIELDQSPDDKRARLATFNLPMRTTNLAWMYISAAVDSFFLQFIY